MTTSRPKTSVIMLVMALGLSLLAALPASAHPEDCAVTDDAATDQACEEQHGKEGDESGELSMLPEDEDVLGTGPGAVFTASRNMHPQGFSERSVPLTGPGSNVFNSDLAFYGTTAVQGTYGGFRLIDIADPENPRQIVDYADCVRDSNQGSQGDIVIHGDILLRSWDAPRAATLLCGDVVTPAGQEGMHVFDISDPTAPRAVSFVRTPCGSHTASAVPDPANGRLLVYSSPSSSAVGCRGIDIIQVPLAAPASASYLRFVPSGDPTPTLPNQVTVTSASATTTYGGSAAAFGPPLTAQAVSGPIVAASPALACDPIAPVPSGSVVVVDRGVCGFAVKVLNAQNAGAAAVIVVNNAAGLPGLMGGEDPNVTIPSTMVAMGDGAAIRAALPASASLAAVPQPAAPERACHDTGVILGSVLKAACAGGNGMTMWSMDPADGGSLTNPVVQYSRTFPGVTIGHSAAFTWDGAVVVFGHEPGGGGQARCQESSSAVDRTLYFLDVRTGQTLGEFISPRPQTAQENCTWHNFNVVPTDKAYVMVSGNYQSGISVIDFTNPATPREIASADPAPLSTESLVVGGDWSTYWYNGRIYQSDIRRGLIVWNLSDPAVAGARKLDRSNPQTQEVTFPLRARGTGRR